MKRNAGRAQRRRSGFRSADRNPRKRVENISSRGIDIRSEIWHNEYGGYLMSSLRIAKCIVRESLEVRDTLMHVFLKMDYEYSIWSVYHIALGEPWFIPNRRVQNYRLREMGYTNFTYYGYRADGTCSNILTIEPGVKL